MCTVKTPKVKDQTKPVQYLTNPLLNGLQIGQAQDRNSLRTDVAARVGKQADLAGLAVPSNTSGQPIEPDTKLGRAIYRQLTARRG